MFSTEWEKLTDLELALKLADIADEISMARYQSLDLVVETKPDLTPVSDADKAVEDAIRNQLQISRKTDSVIGEEFANKSASTTREWIIDPIDGTREYIKNKNEYTLNAALILDKKPVLGVIYAPKLKRLFYSFGKNDAYEINKNIKIKLNCKKLSNDNEILALSNSTTPSDIILNIHKKNNVTKFVKCSSSLKFCLIAAGEFDIYAARARAKEWDIAAGHAIAEHAGAILTTFTGRKITYGKNNFANPAMILKRSNNLLK